MWDHTPGEVLAVIARRSIESPRDGSKIDSSKTLCMMRLVSRHWYTSLPLGAFVPLKLWNTTPEFPYARSITIQCPIQDSNALLLPCLTAPKSLHSLHLEHITVDALAPLQHLTSIKTLTLNIAFQKPRLAPTPTLTAAALQAQHNNNNDDDEEEDKLTTLSEYEEEQQEDSTLNLITATTPTTTPAVVLTELPLSPTGSWLAWTIGLENNLTSLTCTGNPIQLQTTKTLAPLAHLTSLTSLTLTDCVLFTDDCIEMLPTSLKHLSVSPAQLTLAGGLKKMLLQRCRNLTSIDVDVKDSASARYVLDKINMEEVSVRLKMLGREVAAVLQPQLDDGNNNDNDGNGGGGVIVHRVSKNPVKSLKVWHNYSSMLLSRGGALDTLLTASLEKLELHSIALSPEATTAIAACINLTHLTAELNFNVRDASLIHWSNLSRLSSLKLTANWYIKESTISTVLSAMPEMEDLHLARLQGNCKSFLEAPLTAMTALKNLKLRMCRLEGVSQFGHVLKLSKNSLQSVSVRWCGTPPDLVSSLASGVQELMCLKRFELSLEGDVEASDMCRLVSALKAGCGSELRELVVDVAPSMFAGRIPSIIYSGSGSNSTTTSEGGNEVVVDVVPPPPVPPVVDWSQLSFSSVNTLVIAPSLEWTIESLTTACTAGQNSITKIVLQDGKKLVTDEWLVAVGRLLKSVKSITLERCQGLSEHALHALHGLTSLTKLRAVGCGGLGGVEGMEEMRRAVPGLVEFNVYE